MLGAFVVPVARIAELAAALPESGSSSWPVSVLAPSLDALPKSHDGRLHIRALEIAPQEPKTILAGGGGPLEGAQVFHEVPLDDCMEARLDAIGRVGAASKVRTGGVVSDAFPAAPRLADFLGACAERGLAFKATAGLHHATHGRYALTYERGSPFTSMYGFLDLALVATLLRARRVATRDAVDLLRGCGGGVVHEAKGFRWCGHRMSFDEIAETRSTFFLSFGSCSFEEPVADLKRMGLL
jgi:hypothetical protein